ncbi:hypothetical protein B0H14DRAFT_3507141 [Mycena olivaceomarginata]|nr:hypothetical protein B0H14DRAFT_3507141 [Mycena olivaceomarginata]
MAAAASPSRFISQSDAGAPHRSMRDSLPHRLRSRARVHPLDVPSCHCGRNLPLAGANVLLKPAPPPMATISLYTTAPSLAQADGILDTHILSFSPDLLQTPEPSPLRPPLHSWSPHLILDATPQTVLQLQNTLRALILSTSPRRRGVGRACQTTCSSRRTCTGSACPSSSCSAGSPSAPSPRWARASTPTRGGAPEKLAYLLNNATKALGLGLDVDALPDAVQADLLVQQIGDYAKARFGAAVLSLELVHRLGAIREAKRVLGDLVQVVYLDLVVGNSALDNFTPPTVPISFYIYFLYSILITLPLSSLSTSSREGANAFPLGLRNQPALVKLMPSALGLACANAHAATTIMIALDTRSSRSCTQRIPRPECVPPGTAQSVREPHPAQPALGTRQPASQRIETHLVEGGRIALAQPTYCERSPSFHAHPFSGASALIIRLRKAPRGLVREVNALLLPRHTSEPRKKHNSALLSSWMTTGGGPSTSMGGKGSVPVLASNPNA